MSPHTNNNFYDDDSDTNSVNTNNSCHRKVHFQPWVNFVTIPHVSDYSKEEIESAWYSPKELRSRKRSMRKQNITNIDAQHVGLSVGQVLTSTDDINHPTGVIIAALDDEGLEEAGVLADAYLTYTRSSQSAAVERARSQEKDVRLHNLFQW